MNFNRVLAILVLTSSPISILALPSAKSAGLSSVPAQGTVAQFTVGSKTQVPGHALKEGSYKLAVIDNLTDRMVLRVTSESGKEIATFLALRPDQPLPGQSGQGAILLGGHGQTALRGFVFPDGSVAEFVYPKAEAVALAKASDTTIPAVDPASEGLSASSDLSPSDMELVTLWILTPVTVGPGKEAGIEAQRYQQVADASTSPRPDVRPTPSGADGTAVASEKNSQPYQMASNTPPARPKSRATAHAVAVLPHTASSLPIFILAGFLSMLLASFLTFRRLGEELELR